jgi:hypothetical protein
MLSRVTYYNSNDSLITQIFPSYFWFFTAYCVVGLILCIICWVIILPSQNAFSQNQAVLVKNPTYEKICDIEKKLENIEKRLSELHESGLIQREITEGFKK